MREQNIYCTFLTELPPLVTVEQKIRWHVKEPSASEGCNLDLPTDFCYAHIWSIGFVCIAPKQSTNTLGLVTCLSFIQFRLIDPSCNRTMIEYFYP